MAKYCDLAKVGAGTGTSGDPYSFDDIDSLSKGALRFPGSGLIGDTLYIKGLKDVDVTAYGATALYITTDGGDVKAWDTTVDPVNGVDEPWRINANATASVGVVATSPYAIEGAIISNSNDLSTFCQFYGLIRNCFFLIPNLSTVRIDIETASGCTIIAPNTSCSTSAYTPVDCIFDISSFNTNVNASNCVFTCANDATPGTRTNCQYSWTPPTWPAWNDPKASFANSILTSGVTIPPQPGNAPYTGYDKGLWRNARTGIGAVSFYVTPAMNILPPVDNVGTGAEIFKQKTPSNENQLRSLVAGTGIALTQNTDDITVAVASGVTKTYTNLEFFIPAKMFVSAQSPFTAAPIENFYIAANGLAMTIVRYEPSINSAASFSFSADFANNGVGSAPWFFTLKPVFFTTGGSTNTIDINLQTVQGVPGVLAFNSAFVDVSTTSPVGKAAYISNQASFAVSVQSSESIFNILVQRKGSTDTNPDVMYLTGLKATIQQGLY